MWHTPHISTHLQFSYLVYKIGTKHFPHLNCHHDISQSMGIWVHNNVTKPIQSEGFLPSFWVGFVMLSQGSISFCLKTYVDIDTSSTCYCGIIPGLFSPLNRGPTVKWVPHWPPWVGVTTETIVPFLSSSKPAQLSSLRYMIIFLKPILFRRHFSMETLISFAPHSSCGSKLEISS